MELPDDPSRVTILVPSRQQKTPLAPRPAAIIDDPDQPHCGEHHYFVSGCAICKQACANFQPYPARPSKPPLPRSFGYTDDITAAKLLVPRDTTYVATYGTDPGVAIEAGLSLMALRFLLRLIWPFSRIL